MISVAKIGTRASRGGGGGDAELVLPNLYVNLDASNASSYPGTGTTWFDLSGNSNDFTLYNGVSYSASEGGQLVCDGVNDYIQSNAQIDESGASGAYSVFVYYKVADLTQGALGGNYLQYAACKRPNTGASTSYWQMLTLVSFADWATYTQSAIKSVQFDGSGSGLEATQGAWPVSYPQSNDEWVYVGFTTDGSNGGDFKVYFNGNEAASETLTFDVNTGADYIRLMSNGWNTSYAVEGSIRNLHVYNRKLSPDEVVQNYNAISL